MAPHMYEFARAAVTKYHTLGGLKEQRFTVSQFWRLEVQNQVIFRAMLSENYGEIIHCLPLGAGG